MIDHCGVLRGKTNGRPSPQCSADCRRRYRKSRCRCGRGRAQSRCRCGRGRARSRCRCGEGRPNRGADVAGGAAIELCAAPGVRVGDGGVADSEAQLQPVVQRIPAAADSARQREHSARSLDDRHGCRQWSLQPGGRERSGFGSARRRVRPYDGMPVRPGLPPTREPGSAAAQRSH